MTVRVGIGVDAHRRAAGRPLYLGGLEISSEFGLEAHSDGDVVCHAIIEALLGAAGMGDKGSHFPPTDTQYRDIRSTLLLQRVVEAIEAAGFQLANVDVSVMCEEPRISAHTAEMRRILSQVLKVDAGRVSIKGTTLERMGFTGRNEGIAAIAVALIEKKDIG